jgi:hypothetical protein
MFIASPNAIAQTASPGGPLSPSPPNPSRLTGRPAQTFKEQQKWQTTVISVMVVVMVGFGLILSALQFYSDFRSRGKSSVTIKIGSGTFELSSTVIGLAILAMSFWFFQTYIAKVYSVSIFNIQPIDVATFGVNR